MRLLMVSPVPFMPQDAGNRIRIMSILDNIKRLGADVFFLYINCEPADTQGMRSYMGADRYFEIPAHRYGTAVSKLRRVIKKVTDSGKPFYVQNSLDDYCGSRIPGFVKALDNEYGFDVCWVEYVFMSRVFEVLGKDCRKVLDTHDVFTDRYRGYIKEGVGYRWFSTSKKDELRGFMRADKVVAIQKRETEWIRTATGRDCADTLGHPVHIEKLPHCSSKTILYLASGNGSNRVSIKWFVREVLPKVKAGAPDVKLVLAGSICGVGNELENKEGTISYAGIVEDVGDAYRASSVVINPALFGTGLKIKTIEALGYGKPVVTTSTGADGIEEASGKCILVADEAEQFAELILKLFEDRELYDRMSSNALEYTGLYNDAVYRKIKQLLFD